MLHMALQPGSGTDWDIQRGCGFDDAEFILDYEFEVAEAYLKQFKHPKRVRIPDKF